MKRFAIFLAILLLILPLYSAKRHYHFISADISVNDNTTATNGTEFDSKKITIKAEEAGITIKFKPATPAAVAVTFSFHVSPDKGDTWTSKPVYEIEVDTDETQNSDGEVIVFTQVNVKGGTHIILHSVVVGNGAGNCTEINAIASFVYK